MSADATYRMMVKETYLEIIFFIILALSLSILLLGVTMFINTKIKKNKKKVQFMNVVFYHLRNQDIIFR